MSADQRFLSVLFVLLIHGITGAEHKNTLFFDSQEYYGYERQLWKYTYIGIKTSRLMYFSNDHMERKWYAVFENVTPIVRFPVSMKSFELSLLPMAFFLYENREIILESVELDCRFLYQLWLSESFRLDAGMELIGFWHTFALSYSRIDLLSKAVIRANVLF